MPENRLAPARELLALFDAVKEAPHDDTPRLVLADWLEEYGDADSAYGEFIRIQCELARMPLTDPRRADLRRREKALRQKHAAAWLRPFSELIPDWEKRDWTFQRGLAQIWLSDKDLTPELKSASAAESWARVEKLRAVVDPRGLLDLLSFPGLAALSALHLDTSNYGGFTRNHQEALAGCPHLRRVTDLNVRSCVWCEGVLGSRGTAFLVGSALAGRLTSLELSSSAVNAASAEAVAKAPLLAGLTRLTLPGDLIRPEGVKALVKSPHLGNLEHLSLHAITRASLQALTSPTAFPRLRSLDLPYSTIGPNRPYRLATWPRLAGLTELSVPKWNLGREGVGALLRSPHATGLRSLNLSFNDLRADAGAELAAAPGLRQVTSLRLFGNHLGPEGVAALMASPHLEHLEDLDLGANNLGAVGIAALVEKPLPPNLRRLSLAMNSIGPQGAKALAKSPHVRQLTSLDLWRSTASERPIGPEGAKALAASPHLVNLTDLNVQYNALGQEGKEALEQSRHLQGLIELDTALWEKE